MSKINKKYILCVHSTITYEVSKSIIKELGIKKDSELATARGFKVAGSNPLLNLDDIYSKNILQRKFYKVWEEIQKGDKLLSNAIGGNFHAFIPQTWQKKYDLLTTHKDCLSFSYIEEGLASYHKKNKIEQIFPAKKYGIKSRLKTLGRLREKKFYKDNYKKVWATNKNAFPNFKRKNYVNLSFNEKDLPNISKGSCILVLTDQFALNEDERQIYMLVLGKIVRYLDNIYNTIYYKIHPNVSNTVLENITNKLISINSNSSAKLGCGVEYVTSNMNIDVFMDVSSLAIYSSLNNCNVYSYYPIFKNMIAHISGKNPSISPPSCFWEYAYPITRSDI